MIEDEVEEWWYINNHMVEIAKTPYDGTPFYCVTCGAGPVEYNACEEVNCQLESIEDAQARRRNHNSELELCPACGALPIDQTEKPIMRATVYHAGTDSFYDALLLKKLSKEDLEAE